MSRIEQILELARWAPSGDNTQPWRFEIIDELHLVVHGFDTRTHCVYDLDGHASQLALGCLLETMKIAASALACRTEILRRREMPDEHPTFDIHFSPDASVIADPLISFIKVRSVQRRAMRMRPLSSEEKATLEQCIGPQYRLIWKEHWTGRWQSARLMYANAKIRLTTPEAYEVHSAIIEWNSQFSETMVPDQAVGLDKLTLHLMRWAMKSWKRVDFMNRYLMGTVIPRLQLDLIPGLACAAHFGLASDTPPTTVDDYVAAGRQVQRLWLTATRIGLQVQPEMTPVIFSRYVRETRSFTKSPKPVALAKRLAHVYDKLFGEATAGRVIFVGRIGAGPAAHARSTRLPISKLLKSPQ